MIYRTMPNNNKKIDGFWQSWWLRHGFILSLTVTIMVGLTAIIHAITWVLDAHRRQTQAAWLLKECETPDVSLDVSASGECHDSILSIWAMEAGEVRTCPHTKHVMKPIEGENRTLCVCERDTKSK